MVSFIMQRVLLISILLSCSGLFAQDWALFPVGQKSTYVQEFINGRIQVLVVDSVNGNTHYFNQQPLTDISLNLYGQVLDNNFSIERLDSIVIYEDSSLLYTYLGPVTLITSILPGETLPLGNGFNEDCWVDEEMVFGVYDSVKTFYIWNSDFGSDYPEIVYRLSKSFGLIEFAHPLVMQQLNPPITYNSFYLGAAEKDGIYWGDEFAGWSDFFPVAGGDRLYYRYTENYYLDFADTTFREVYIISSTRYEDSLVVVAQDKYIKLDGEITYSNIYETVYSKWYFEPIFSARAYTPIIYNQLSGDYSEVFYSMNRYYEYVVAGKIASGFNVYYSGDYLSDDVFYVGTDMGWAYKYSTFSGRKLFKEYGFYGNAMDTLIGFHIGDSIWGITDLTTEIPEINSDVVEIYPNPAQEYIRIKGLTSAAYHWQIFDIQGREQLNGYHSDNELFIGKLLPGTYLLWIEGLGSAVFMKE